MDGLIFKKIDLKAGEEVVAVVRRFGMVFWPKILAAILLLALAFFFIFPLFDLGQWGVAIFLFLILLALIYAANIFVVWYYNVFIVTDRRVIDIDQRGFFDRIVSEAPLRKIEDVTWRRRGFWQTIFRYGNVRIKIIDSDSGLEIVKVRRPEKISQVIIDLANLKQEEPDEDEDGDEDEGREASPNDEEFAIIKESIDDLDEEQLEELAEIIGKKLQFIEDKRRGCGE